jgi:hypothetical protein
MEELESIENPIKLEEGKTYTFYVWRNIRT